MTEFDNKLIGSRIEKNREFRTSYFLSSVFVRVHKS